MLYISLNPPLCNEGKLINSLNTTKPETFFFLFLCLPFLNIHMKNIKGMEIYHYPINLLLCNPS